MKQQKIIKTLQDAIGYHQAKDFIKAEKLYKKVLVAENKNYDALRHLGILRLDQNLFSEAKNLFEKSIRSNNKLPHAYNNLGQYYFFTGDFPLALKNFYNCLDCDPSYWPAINNLGKFFLEVQDRDKALHFAELAYMGNQNDLEAKKTYAQALILNEKYIESIDLLKQIIGSHKDLGAYNIIQDLYKDLGSLDLSLDFCKQALKIDSLDPLSIYNISYFKNYDYENPELAEDIVKKLEKKQIIESMNKKDLSALYFGLYRIFERKKEYKQAFKYVSQANKLLDSTFSRDICTEYQYLEELKKHFNPKFIKEYSKFGSSSKRPIFIIGMPRSGTTLIEQILSSHSNIYGAGELTYMSRVLDIGSYNENGLSVDRVSKIKKWFEKSDIEKMSNQYIKSVEEIDNITDFTTDKLPHNFILLGFIKILFPYSKIIYCNRNPMDNCYSIYRIFFNAKHYYFYDQKSLAQYYNFHKELMYFWKNDCMIDMYNLKHEALIENPKKEIENVLKYCEIPWEEDCLNFHKNKRRVKTASNIQVRQPIYKDSLMAWKKYEKELSILKDTLELS